MTHTETADVEDNLRHTYMAALQHDNVDIPDDALLLGVVQEKMYGFGTYVDENWKELAPPSDVLHPMKDRAAELREEGLSSADAHNTAIEELNFWEHYDEHLSTDDAARDAMKRVYEEAKTRPVYLVCYENIEDKQCHRTTLRDRILEEFGDEDVGAV